MASPMVSVCPGNQDAKAAIDPTVRIIELFNLGKTWKAIAAELAMSERTIRAKAKDLGLSKRKHISADSLRQAVAACSTDQEVAKALNVSIRTVQNYRKTFGVESATSHGGKRTGAGRKSSSEVDLTKSIEELRAVHAMMEQQIIDARVNSFEARVRTNRSISITDWLRWAPSAFKYDDSYTNKVVREGYGSYGMPKSIPMVGQNFLPGDTDGCRKAGKASTSTVQAIKAAQGQ